MTIVHARGELGGDHCLVMGILNRTPDSFYDGGRMDLPAAVSAADEMIAEGADIIDVGGVKAGPGPVVAEPEERERLVPLVEAIADRSAVPVSVETARPAVARAALEAGAAIVNDVTAFQDDALLEVCGASRAAVVLMHHGGQIRARPRNPRYDDIVGSVKQTWDDLARRAHAAGVAADAVIVDPGLDFGKTTFHSLEIMGRLHELSAGPWPVLVAPSRKDVVGETLDIDVGERLPGTLALVALSVIGGARVVRVHDVGEAVHVVRMVEAVHGRRSPVAPIRGLWD